MSLFTIRVELHDASWSDYNALAKQLAQQGVVDVIRGDDGRTYKLPPAEYNYEGNATAEQVRDAVRRVANVTGRQNAVFVSDAICRSWAGLEFA